MAQIESDYSMKLETTAMQSYHGKRSDMVVDLSVVGDVWHTGITDQEIQMDDLSLS
jgi:hypothetical protein